MDEQLHRSSAHFFGTTDDRGPEGHTETLAKRSQRRIDFNLLLPLQALLTEANVTRAAERTNVGQPAMSASLAKLRRHFKDQLLVRNGRGMKLTPFATSLSELVNQAVDSMQRVIGHHTAFDPDTLRRTFTVITSDYVTIILLKPFLRSIMDTAPGIMLNVVPPGPHTLSALRRVECDLLIAPREMLPHDLAGYPNRDLFADRFVVVADKDNTALGGSLTIGELAGLPFIDTTPDLELSEQGVSATICLCAGNFGASMHLVAGTSMVTLAQVRLYEEFGSHCGLRAIPLREQLPLIESMYWHPRHTTDPAHSWLRGKIGEVAASL